MKLRIGDKVRFLNEVGEGVVSRIKDQSSVYVEMQDGFEIPFLIKQLVPIHTELILNKDAENIELNTETQLNDAIYFIIEPDHDLQSLINDYKIYLFNASSFNVVFTYSIKDDAYFQTLKHGEVGAYQKIALKNVKLNYFEEFNFHKIECLFYKNSHYKAQLPVSVVLNVSPKILSKSNKVKHDEFKHFVYAFMLKDDFIFKEEIVQELSLIDIAKLEAIKEFKTKNKISKSNKEYLKSLELEVDLHIEELVENINGLSNFEMLNIQIEKFDKTMDIAFENNTKKIIFIHGIGNGRLKAEIINRLKHIKGITFHDASHKEYGFGATQVNIL
jgi:hypothetical protein